MRSLERDRNAMPLYVDGHEGPPRWIRVDRFARNEARRRFIEAQSKIAKGQRQAHATRLDVGFFQRPRDTSDRRALNRRGRELRQLARSETLSATSLICG